MVRSQHFNPPIHVSRPAFLPNNLGLHELTGFFDLGEQSLLDFVDFVGGFDGDGRDGDVPSGRGVVVFEEVGSFATDLLDGFW